MTAAEIAEKATESPNKGVENKDDLETAPTLGQNKSKTNKNWLGKEVKRPRAEYQAEIDELKVKLAELETNLEDKTIELKQFKDWVSMAPSAF